MERTLKLTIDTKQQRVLFAEADKPFVDFIFSFLITPMGGYNVGHLPTISQSVKNFKAEYMDSSSVKGFLTNPKSPFVSSLLPIPQPPCPLSSFTGANYCPHCSRQLYTPIPDYTLAAVGMEERVVNVTKDQAQLNIEACFDEFFWHNLKMEVSLKLTIDKKQHRVLFAEADKEFVDFVFSLLIIPLGKSNVGCMPNIYRSVKNLKDNYMASGVDKVLLMNPNSPVSFVSSPLPPSLIPPTIVLDTYYKCLGCVDTTFVSLEYGVKCPRCSKFMFTPLTSETKSRSDAGRRGFVKGGVGKYMVMDDLSITHLDQSSSIINLLKKMNINSLDAVHERVVRVTTDKAQVLLELASTSSNTVLTNAFLDLKMEVSLKLMIDKKQHRVLFAEANKEFVDFIFGFLYIPMGKCNVGCMPSIYRSLRDFNDDCMASSVEKRVLMNPKSPVPFVSSLLPTSMVQSPKPIHKTSQTSRCFDGISPPRDRRTKDAGRKGFVKGGALRYMVMDDLSVTHLDQSSSIINLLKKMNINSLDAVEERVVRVTRDTAQVILELALTSNTVLTTLFLGEEAGSSSRKRVKKEFDFEMEVSLKLTIDRKQHRVLFAEADKAFVDFIFSLLIVPMGGSNVGCLPAIYQSVKNLKDGCMDSSSGKGFLMNPKSPVPFISSLLPPPLVPRTTDTFYKCLGCINTPYVSSEYGVKCPRCSKYMFTPFVSEKSPLAFGKGFVKGGELKYMVMDDLSVTHMDSPSSIIHLLKNMNLNSLDALEERVVHITKDQAQVILELALTSNIVLTNVFLGEEAGSNAKESVKKASK
ncbi:hypothetical protein OSB04_014525 [Centaurea solstitialis]|uniref:Uncharacterized protein n=1 Tax=Centaurea solstitialis TaxID=347529 RepID=A0AA38T987_9ASTR|nr:hypothetical protein OSB04_014525 [Centaurea solstitialis]